MNFTEQFKEEEGYDAYAYDENKQGQPRVIGYCENYVEWLECKLKNLLIPIVSGSFIVNGFEITQHKNLHPSMLSWQAKHLLKDITFAGKSKKECVSWCENYR